MKIKKLVPRVVIILMASAFIATGCSTSAEKVNNAEDKVALANKNLNDANAEYIADMEAYRKETAAKIAANNASIAAFNARIESDKKEAQAEYKKKITALEQKNTDMKKRLEDYKANGKDKWQAFKEEFSHDMAELGQAFKDLTVSNAK